VAWRGTTDMFGFLNAGVRDANDPIISAKTAATWLRELPSLDIVARQQTVVRALEGLRLSRRPMDFSRAQALQYTDAALGADRRQLLFHRCRGTRPAGFEKRLRIKRRGAFRADYRVAQQVIVPGAAARADALRAPFGFGQRAAPCR